MGVSIAAIETWIRDGALVRAAQALRTINRNEIERRDLAHIASLATRAGEAGLAIRWLNPIVRAEKKLMKPATPRERAEYGVALIRIGAQPEALKILETVSPKDFPQTLLFRAIAHFPQWDYAQALPLLEQYLESDLPEYQRTVGLVNYSAALIFEYQFDRAERSLSQAIRYARSAEAKLLLGNCLELSAQLAIGRGNLKSAARYLGQADQALREGGRLDSFFVRKWGAVVSAKAKPGARSLAGLEAIRKEAHEIGHWESVRDCDFYRAILTRDPRLIAHLYHGTPFARFRRQLLVDLKEGVGEEPPIPEVFDWILPRGRAHPARVLDLALGEVLASKNGLKPNQVPHRLLMRLALDFYRPATLASLFATLFPSDYFHPEHSANRTHQALSRLRLWLSKARLPLVIRESGGHYSLDAGSAMAIRTTLVPTGSGSSNGRLERIRRAFGSDFFSSSEASRCLGTSARTAMRWVLRSTAAGLLLQKGTGSARRYRIIQ